MTGYDNISGIIDISTILFSSVWRLPMFRFRLSTFNHKFGFCYEVIRFRFRVIVQLFPAEFITNDGRGQFRLTIQNLRKYCVF